jgi:protein-S-isoprenylcysteine O-methyltransferase Ste14
MPDRFVEEVARRRAGLAEALARRRVPLGFVCAAAVLWLAGPTRRSLAIGCVTAVVGELLRIWAAGHLEKGREVTRSGPYRFTRHPLYMGSGIIAIGVAVAAASPAAAAIIGVYFVATVSAAIRTEEANMRASFGDQYDAYAQSRARPVARPFSLRRAIWNKEHKTVAGLAVVAAILALKAVIGQQ